MEVYFDFAAFVNDIFISIVRHFASDAVPASDHDDSKRAPNSELTKGCVLGTRGGIGGMPGVFWAEATGVMRASRTPVAAITLRTNLFIVIPSPFTLDNRSGCRTEFPWQFYSGKVLVPVTWNVPATVGASVFG